MEKREYLVPEEEMKRQEEFAAMVRELPHRPKSYHVVTYGCQMNAHDSEKLAGMLDGMGMTPAPRKEEADFVLHNTCCIRDNAERKALGNVTWLKEVKKERPDMLIGVCGCMVQEPGMADKLLRQYPFVDVAFGTGNIHQLPELLYRAAETRRRVVAVPEEQSTIAEGLPIRRESPFQSYVTIMYGCNNFCSYCIVPYVRGRERSRTADDIVREVEALARQFNGTGAPYLSHAVITLDAFHHNYFRKDCFNGIIRLPFESIELPVPAGYDSFLTSQYGDWHAFPPVEKRGDLHSDEDMQPDIPYEEALAAYCKNKGL